ncbi:MAG: FxsA family protein [Nannocystaceae bacterium]|nr:FxsA family protein [Nannocystaceae bacterium]
MRPLPLALLAFAVLELWLLVVLGRSLGGLPTFGLVLGSAVAGVAIARAQARAALHAVQQAAITGAPVDAALGERAALVLAGALLIVPGVISDGLALALLLPPVRRVLARRVGGALGSRLQARSFAAMQAQTRGASAPIIDLDPASVRDAQD